MRERLKMPEGDLFMGTVSEKVRRGGLKKKDEDFDLERTHPSQSMERREECERKGWAIEAREVILFFALKGERILFVANEGWVLAGSRSGHILYLWTSSRSCLLADWGVALAQECDPVKSCISLHPSE